VFLLFCDDTNLRSSDELDDVSDEWPVGDLLLNLVHCVEHRRLAVEQQTVGVGNVFQCLLVDTMLARHLHIDTTILDMLGTYDIRRNVLRERRTSLDHRTLSHARLGILDDAGREDDTILDDAVACYLRAIAEDAAIAHLRVVRDVGTLHQHVVVAENGLTTSVRSAVDDDVLADDVTITDNALRLLATELKVLRQGSDDTALMHLILRAHARTIHNTDEGEDDAAVAYFDVVLDINEGEYLTIVADFRLRADFGFGGNFACHNSYFLHLTSNILFSASAKSSVQRYY